MKCLILAAGYATRLYPLTENFPKPLLTVGDKAILDWLIDDIGDAAEQYIVISNHKFAHHFERWAAERPEGWRCSRPGAMWLCSMTASAPIQACIFWVRPWRA